ncbi:MAG TPA: response regulator transcription factor [Kofleriaceae bacterium]|nr:response regulator transcription factor [Kofleriaceae bacterium]
MAIAATCTKDTLLVVEDDREMRELLCEIFGSRGFRTVEAGSGTEAEELVVQLRPEAILLDLGLPDSEGVSVLQRLRERWHAPIIVVSATKESDRKVEALDAGADDFVTKPFSHRELIARVKVALRRLHRRQAAPPTVLAVGAIKIDTERHEVSVDNVLVRLTPIEFRLLEQLARHAGRVRSHRELLEAVWGPEKAHETHYLRVHIQALRRKIERDPARPRWILTEAGIGYRLREDPSVSWPC